MRALALLAASLVLCAHAEVYKWVDEKGQTQYGQSPPPGADATRMNVPTGGPDSPPAEKAKEPAAKAASTEDKKERCEFERKQQEVVNNKDAPVTYKNDKGEMVALDEARRNEANERIRENIKKYCS